MLPSVTMSSDAGIGIGYTGIHIRGTDPTRINVSVNGISLNDSESAQLYWVNMADFASSLEDIQVQRGVGTSTNGFSGFGAIINMKTDRYKVHNIEIVVDKIVVPTNGAEKGGGMERMRKSVRI